MAARRSPDKPSRFGASSGARPGSTRPGDTSERSSSTPGGGSTEIIYDSDLVTIHRRTSLLRVVHGPDRGRDCRLIDTRVRVGTGPECDLRLTDKQVSRHHLEVRILDRGFLVRDLQSSNGTFYRGARVNEVVVGPGAELHLGATVLHLERAEETSAAVVERQEFGGLIGASAAMQRVFGLLSAVAPSEATVLVEGETGTGKEMVAAELHRHSCRAGQPFTVVDCGAIPEQLIESELFGHARGAFTGAERERVGAFDRSRGGTVFLDEVGEIPLPMQTRLLRVLDQRTVKRVGEDHPRKVDVRLVAATNRDLKKEVKAGRFRADLYYRLAVMRVVLPPLRKRREDIPLLARHFLWQCGCTDIASVLNDELLAVLDSRSWPGNVRELRNVIERAMVLTSGSAGEGLELSISPATVDSSAAARPGTGQVGAVAAPAREDHGVAPDRPAVEGEHQDALPPLLIPPGYMDLSYKQAKELLVDQFQRQYLKRLMSLYGTNITHMASAGGFDRHLVRKLLRKHGLMD